MADKRLFVPMTGHCISGLHGHCPEILHRPGPLPEFVCECTCHREEKT